MWGGWCTAVCGRHLVLRAPHAMYAHLLGNKLTEMKRIASDSIADAKVLYIVSNAIYTLLPSVNQSHATARR